VKAILCQRFGAPDDLVLADIPDPVAGPGEVVAKVAAVGLNFFDTLIIAGKYQTKPPFPFSPGGEFAGVVESVGAGVTEFKPGDCVMGYTNFNAARERTAVPTAQIVKIAGDLDFDRAAALTITYGTAYHALKHRARLRSGETLAVLGASGGVGLATVELGKIMGARVIACASTDDKLAFARAHGADDAVNYDKENLRDALKRTGGEHGIDVVFDPVGGPYSEPAIRSLAWEGRHLVVGFASSRSIWCCSRTAPSWACSGAPGSATPRRTTRPRSPSSRNGAARASSPAISSKSIRSPRRPRRSRRSPTARSWVSWWCGRDAAVMRATRALP
jgi:NADPH2:quinone reductase